MVSMHLVYLTISSICSPLYNIATYIVRKTELNKSVDFFPNPCLQVAYKKRATKSLNNQRDQLVSGNTF